MALNENMALAKDIFVPINPEDDDLAHIITHKTQGIENPAMAIHIQSHVEAHIAKGGSTSQITPADEQAQKLQQSMAGQSMANQVAASN